MNERSAGKDPASSPDGLAAFQTCTNLINSERETLWARHNALVLANSLIIGALAISPAALWENKWAALGMLGAGLVICAAWFLMTVLAWSAMRRHCDLAASFASSCFAHLPNPFAETICNREQRGIHRLTLLVIGVFILMYFGLGYIRLASV
jgi:hypothetical protein